MYTKYNSIPYLVQPSVYVALHTLCGRQVVLEICDGFVKVDRPIHRALGAANHQHHLSP